MNSLNQYLTKLPGVWENLEFKQVVRVYQSSNETYLVEYNPPLIDSPEGEQESIRIMPLSNDLLTIKFSNCRGAWQLQFLTKDKFELRNLTSINKSLITCIFNRVTKQKILK